MKTIAARQLSSYLRGHPQALLVDLRSRQAYGAGHVRRAVNLPYEALDGYKNRLPQDREVIFYCERGGSAMAAARRLGEEGWETTAVIGGYEDISRLTETVSGFNINTR